MIDDGERGIDSMQHDDPEEDIHGIDGGDCDCNYELVAPEKEDQEGDQKVELSVRAQGHMEERQQSERAAIAGIGVNGKSEAVRCLPSVVDLM